MSKYDDLEKLAKLKKQGVITKAEFEEQKKKLLGQISDAPRKSMWEHYKTCWKKYFTISGRATRSEYWYFFLANWLVCLALGVLGAFASLFNIIAFLYFFVTMIPSITVCIRRFHDRGHSAWFALVPWWLFLGLVVLVLWGLVCDYFGLICDAEGTSPAFQNIFSIVFVVGGFLMIPLSFIWLIFLCLPGTPGPNKYGAEEIRVSGTNTILIVALVLLILLSGIGGLSIVGILGVGAISGYTSATNRHRADQIIDAAAKISVLAQVSRGDTDPSTIGTTLDAIAPGLGNIIAAQGTGIVTITWGTVDPAVRAAVKSILGAKSSATCATAVTCTLNFAD